MIAMISDFVQVSRTWRDTRLTSAKGSRADIKSRCPARTLGSHRPPAGKANTPAVTSVAAAPFKPNI
jgi:hypothetical protein